MAQYLKQEIEQAIYAAAVEEFYTKGYDKASVHQIAKTVGISVGNIYRYYENKAALFAAVVEPSYQRMTEVLERFDPALNTGRAAYSLADIIEELEESLTAIVLDYHIEMRILMDGSAGTAYARAKAHLFEILTAYILQHVEKLNRGRPRKDGLNPLVAKPVAVSFLEGYTEIIRMANEQEDIHKMVKDYIWIFSSGLRQLM